MNNDTQTQTRQVIDHHARNFVAPVHVPQQRQTPVLPEAQSSLYAINVAPSSTQQVTVTTNATDRAFGYLLETLPLFGSFGTVSLLTSVYFYEVPIFSVTALVIYFVTFVGAWLIAYFLHKFLSAEGVSFFEAVMKWVVILLEQKHRWRYYEK